jgi:hypothetical protein
VKARRCVVTISLAASAVLLGVFACRGRSGPDLADVGDVATIAALGDYRLDDPAVDRYVKAEVGLDPTDIDPLGRARLREELFGEVLLARAAERESLAGDPGKLAAETERLRRVYGAAGLPAEIARDARRRVLARAYEQTILAPRSTVPAARVTAAASAASSETGQRVVFRQLRVDDQAAAERAYRRIARGEAFEAVAAAVSLSPDRGRPQERALAELPPEVAAALERAREGAVTRPTAVDGAYYVFQLDARSEPGGDQADREDIRRRLEHAAFEELRQRTLAEFARREGVRAPVPAAPAEDR